MGQIWGLEYGFIIANSVVNYRRREGLPDNLIHDFNIHLSLAGHFNFLRFIRPATRSPNNACNFECPRLKPVIKLPQLIYSHIASCSLAPIRILRGKAGHVHSVTWWLEVAPRLCPTTHPLLLHCLLTTTWLKPSDIRKDHFSSEPSLGGSHGNHVVSEYIGTSLATLHVNPWSWIMKAAKLN
jgi:hypothetical protein